MFVNVLKQKVHISWLIGVGSLGVLLGTVGSLATQFFGSVEWLVVGLCISGVALVRPQTGKMLLIFIAGLMVGLSRGGTEQKVRSGLEQLVGETVQVEGFVSDDPTISIDGDTKMIVDVATINGQETRAQIWVSVPQIALQLPDVKRSDAVELRGKIDPGFGTFEVAMYRAELVRIVRTPYIDVARDVRDNFSEHVSEVIDSPESELASGFLLGTKSRLPEKLDTELRLLGLTHIVVASGYNLTILVRLARRLFAKVSRFAALAGSIGLVIAFAYITGWSPSMTRAAMITILSLITWYYGRKTHPFVMLSVVAAASVLVKPSFAWGDIGWLLSFLSFIGVIILAPMLHLYFWGDKVGNTVRQIIIETLSAQIITAPLIIYVFAQYSPLALVANVLVLPFIPLAMLFTFVAGVASYLSLGGLNTVLSWPAQTLLSYMTNVIDWLAAIPFAEREVSLHTTGLVVAYLAMALFMVFLYKRTHYRLRDYNIVE